MNDNDTLAAVRDSLTAAKGSLAGVHMNTPPDAIAREGQASVTSIASPDPSCRPYPMTQALFTSVYPAQKTTGAGITVLAPPPSPAARGCCSRLLSASRLETAVSSARPSIGRSITPSISPSTR
jgi:hypothetical protein